MSVAKAVVKATTSSQQPRLSVKEIYDIQKDVEAWVENLREEIFRDKDMFYSSGSLSLLPDRLISYNELAVRRVIWNVLIYESYVSAQLYIKAQFSKQVKSNPEFLLSAYKEFILELVREALSTSWVYQTSPDAYTSEQLINEVLQREPWDMLLLHNA